MSARTCQLCGKPLSRIWVGSGDDFCSREHRNQYRLRKGMDRLLEDNKVATLMRRREQLKPLSGSCLVASAQTPRMFSRAQIPTRPRALALQLMGNDLRISRVGRLLQGVLGRIRDVRVGPDGFIYLLTDESSGVLARLEPTP